MSSSSASTNTDTLTYLNIKGKRKAEIQEIADKYKQPSDGTVNAMIGHLFKFMDKKDIADNFTVAQLHLIADAILLDYNKSKTVKAELIDLIHDEEEQKKLEKRKRVVRRKAKKPDKKKKKKKKSEEGEESSSGGKKKSSSKGKKSSSSSKGKKSSREEKSEEDKPTKKRKTAKDWSYQLH